MPTPRPSDLKSPVPSTQPAPESFDQFEASQFPSSFDEFEMQSPAVPTSSEELPGYHGPGRGAIQAAATMAPTVLGIGGGILGAGAGGVGAIPGVGLGAMAGHSIKELIEVNILGRPEGSLQESLTEGVKTGAKEAATQAAGMGVLKLGGKAANTPAGRAALAKVEETVGPAVQYVKSTMERWRGEALKPALELIFSKLHPDDAAMAGDKAKQLIQQEISKRVNSFNNYEAAVEAVTKSTPLKNLVQVMKDEPSEKFLAKLWDPENYAAMKAMKEQMPDVFDVVAKSRMTQIAKEAGGSGKLLNVGGINESLKAMPTATRRLLVDDGGMEVMKKVLTGGKLKRLDHMEKLGNSMVANWAKQAYAVAMTGAEKAVENADTMVGRQIIGKGVMKLAEPKLSPMLDAFSHGQAPQE